MFIPTRCAICQTEDNAAQIYPAHLPDTAFQPETFSARRDPDRVHYRVVQCNTCGLVRSDPVMPAHFIDALYSKSIVHHIQEVNNLTRTYGEHVLKASRYVKQKKSLLEIGSGTGFLLEEALRQGFESVSGVEPSRAAVKASQSDIRKTIINDVMRPGLFSAESFDMVCMMQVIDHVSDPAALLGECYKLLRPGGALLIVSHNVRALSARLLGSYSPIVDIEHTFLFSSRTIKHIVSTSGFTVRKVSTLFNRYSLRYLVHLVPLPQKVKDILLNCHALMRPTLRLPLGNFYIIATKPEVQSR